MLLNLLNITTRSCAVLSAVTQISPIWDAKESLERLKPAIFCEVDASYTSRLGYTPAEFFQDMNSMGYHPFVFGEQGVVEQANYDRATDYLFLRPEHLQGNT